MSLENSFGYKALDIGMFNSLVISINLYNIYYIALLNGNNEVANILREAGAK